MHNPYIAIAAAALAAWIFGAIWYGILGRAWMAAQGLSQAEIDAKRQVRQMPLAPMAISFLCELVLSQQILLAEWIKQKSFLQNFLLIIKKGNCGM